MVDQVGHAAQAHRLGVWIAIPVGIFIAFACVFLSAFAANEKQDD